MMSGCKRPKVVDNTSKGKTKEYAEQPEVVVVKASGVKQEKIATDVATEEQPANTGNDGGMEVSQQVVKSEVLSPVGCGKSELCPTEPICKLEIEDEELTLPFEGEHIVVKTDAEPLEETDPDSQARLSFEGCVRQKVANAQEIQIECNHTAP